MAEKLDPKEIVSVEEVILTQAFEQEALVNILEKKGDPHQKGTARGDNEVEKGTSKVKEENGQI